MTQQVRWLTTQIYWASSVTLAVLYVTGCTEPKSPPTQNKNTAPVFNSGSALESYLPLVNGHVVKFKTEDQDGKIEQILGKVIRTTANTAELRIGATAHIFKYTPNAILLRSKEAVFLKAPIAVGTAWTGEHGCPATIASTTRVAEVPAGVFNRCVEVVETCQQAVRPAVFTTVLCPGKGIVLLEAKQGSKFDRASLVSNEPAVDIGGEGLRRIE